ncbi:hypothetical protein KC902_00740 [Candidatus Kaiserbacteria bacterium]|nr:hypothetical protein [Candidatus Kaiserbacteria bacterium]USN88616.1 MAG: hypothetical protein H6780_03970 [Candidatus Nomurabacteria bacterium]
MDSKTQEQINEIERKVAAIYVSVEKTRKYMLITAWVTLAVIVLPLVGLLFAVPALIKTVTEASSLMQF